MKRYHHYATASIAFFLSMGFAIDLSKGGMAVGLGVSAVLLLFAAIASALDYRGPNR